MRLPGYTTIALALVGALALAGCGGGGDSTESSAPVATEAAPTLSKSAFISQGDAICAEVNAAIGSIDSSESASQTQTIQVADLYTGMVESIKGLGEPDEKEGFDEFTAAADELAKAEGEVKLEAEREDPTAVSEAETRAGPAIEGFESAATSYGFQKCGEAPSAPTAPSVPGGVTAGGEEEIAPEGGEEAEVEPELEVSPEGGGEEEVEPESGGTGANPGGGETGGNSGGIGPG